MSAPGDWKSKYVYQQSKGSLSQHNSVEGVFAIYTMLSGDFALAVVN